MAKLEIVDQTGKKVNDLTLNKEVFGIKPNDKVMKDAITVARNSLRQGTAKTKNRSEVSGGGRKPWRQKGTGNARQGSIRAVQWKGGGVAFGPVPRSYSIKQNRKEAKLALKSAWSYKANDNELVVIDKLAFVTPKTKEMTKLLETLKINDKKVLVVVDKYSENVILSSRNLRNVLLMEYPEVSVLDLVSADFVLIENEALKKIEEVLSK
jgi:large subunit ribosomal protein L4